MATAIVDAAAARRDYLDETGGRYVHLIAYGDMSTGGDIAKALACGADAVMLGEPLAAARRGARAAGGTGTPTAAHPRVPALGGRRPRGAGDDERPTLEELLVGPTSDPSGERNLFGAVRRVMGKCGYSSLKEFQKAELIVIAESGESRAASSATRRPTSSSRRRSCCATACSPRSAASTRCSSATTCSRGATTAGTRRSRCRGWARWARAPSGS